uniref:Uncharacterized protein n=1 Tax=Arundo donax TaxID=35708 RepID=A0A0A9ADU7_ARUDO
MSRYPAAVCPSWMFSFAHPTGWNSFCHSSWILF